jgi:hypothetical protein
MMVYVVHNPKTKALWVFAKHADALRWRHKQKLDHWHLWGCAVDCAVMGEAA